MLSDSLSRFLVALVCLSVPAALHAQEDVTPDVAGPTYTESVLVNLTGTTGSTTGKAPEYGGLIQASDGNFYGVASAGGADGKGVLFQLTPAGVYTVMYTFGAKVSNPATPYGTLVQATDGYLYGMTYAGGSSSDGTIYRLLPGAIGTPTVVYSFSGSTSSSAVGDHPYGGLTQATDGYLYGMTYGGGASGYGAVFQLQPGAAETPVLMHGFAGGSDGQYPFSSLVQASDGKLYGTTYLGGLVAGGPGGFGTVFSIPTGTGNAPLILWSFSGSPDGSVPRAGLVQASDGRLYGTTEEGGSSNDGTVFSIQMGAANKPVFLHSFTDTGDGAEPYAPLVEGSDGLLYGTSVVGHPGDTGGSYGTVFQIQTGAADTLAILHFFSGSPDGAAAYDGLIQGADGSFYSATEAGGVSGNGVVFKIAASPALAAPVQLTVPASVYTGASFSLSYLVANAYDGANPGTLNYCFATNTAGDTTGWTGIFTGEPTSQTKTLTAPATAGTYTYTLTCGGQETGIATLTVTVPPNVITFTSTTHNFGQVAVGTAASAYGVKVTNTSTTKAYPFALSFTAASGFTSATNCPASIAIGASCQLAFYFTPTATGAVSVPWSLTPETGFTYSATNGGTLSGAGTSSGGVSLTSAGHNFGVLASGTQSGTYGTELSNSTASAVTLTLGSVTAPFTSLTNCGATLGAGASCELEFYATGTSATMTTTQVFAISATPTGITSGGVALAGGGITLTGN